MTVPVLTPNLLQTPIVDPRTGLVSHPWARYFSQFSTEVAGILGAGGAGLPASGAPPNVGAASVLGALTDFYALQDHTHGALATVAPPAIGGASVLGVSTKLAREDHTHGDLATVAPPDVGGAGVVGVSTKLAREDHTHGGSGESATVTLTNDDEVSLPRGTPVYLFDADGMKRAHAWQSATAAVVGLVADASIAVSASGVVRFGGLLTATTGQWDAVVWGQSGGLLPGRMYFLDPSQPGFLTPAVPTTWGQYAVRIGEAMSPTTLLVSPAPSILL